MLIVLSRLLLAQEPCIPTDISDLTTQAGAQFRDEDLSGALQTIEKAEESIPCANSHLWPYQISMIYQIRAAVAARTEGEGEEEARRWYDHAARMAPSVPFELALYPSGRQHFYAALDAAAQSPTVHISAPSGALLDGVYIPPGSSRDVPRGAHVVQHLTSSNNLVTEMTDFQADAAVGPEPEPEPALASARRPSSLVGAGLVVAGGALLGSSVWWQRRAGEYTVAGLDEAASVSRTANLLTVAGASTLSIGAGAVVVGLRVSDGATVSLSLTR